MSYTTHLECSECREHFDADVVQTYCPDCNTPLLVRYDLERVRSKVTKDQITARHPGMWRWRELLPVRKAENRITLGEGDAPLLKLDRFGAQLGLQNLFVKDESLNPTGSFKARGLAAAIAMAKELGIEKVIIPTAGNAGGAMAAYAARAGMQAYVFMPADTPRANVVESKIYGARVELVDGLINDAGRLAAEKAAEENWFDVSTFKEPYRTEGKKVMGYELAEAFGWKLPDVIIYPTGGGTGLVGMWKAFAELAELGWLETHKRPRMVAVQAAGCAPVVRAFEEGLDHCDFWLDAATIASGLRVPKSFADRIIMRDIEASSGCAVAVTDEELTVTQHELGASEGIFAAPEGAATFTALQKLVEKGWISPEENVVCFNTGAGLKYI